MKRNLLSILAISAALFSCQKNEIYEPSSSSVNLHATIEDQTFTKTYMDENNNIRWSEGDQIVAFLKTSLGLKYQVSNSSVGKSSAQFNEVSGDDGGLNAGTEMQHNVAFYPYSDAVGCLKSGENYALDVILPSEQTYAAESFGNGAMAMVAVSESNNITFRNILGGMKLQLKGTQKVTAITIQGKNNEKLSGAAVVTAYTDGKTKPSVAMSSGASTLVTLSCGSGIQLKESKATEFIIALPPVIFSKGFTVTVIDDAAKAYVVETDKANTVLRSSLLTMPAFKLGSNPADEDDELIVPVSYVNINSTSLKLYEGYVAQLAVVVGPKDATDRTVVWSSSNSSVASVDQTGFVIAHASGNANVTAVADGVVASCSVTVYPAVVKTDYVDEYGVNHGKGTAVGATVWAPVNCGYHKTDYKYGKLYQWGRKYGQGSSGSIYDYEGNYLGEFSDATVPTIEEGGVSVMVGNDKSNADVFYTGASGDKDDWADPRDDKLWNSGTESNPVKTDYDPCPDGWRVPTFAELEELMQNCSTPTIGEKEQSGLWFCGASAYTSEVSQVFFPYAGCRKYDGSSINRVVGYYWTSLSDLTSIRVAYYLYFDDPYSESVYMRRLRRAYGMTVRCVQVTDEVAEL